MYDNNSKERRELLLLTLSSLNVTLKLSFATIRNNHGLYHVEYKLVVCVVDGSWMVNVVLSELQAWQGCQRRWSRENCLVGEWMVPALAASPGPVHITSS